MYFCFQGEKSAREEALAPEACAQHPVNRNTDEQQPWDLELLPGQVWGGRVSLFDEVGCSLSPTEGSGWEGTSPHQFTVLLLPKLLGCHRKEEVGCDGR